MKITSINNEIVKETYKLQQRKYRQETGLFLLEGDKCIEEAIEFGLEIKYIFVLEGYEKFKYSNRIDTTEAVLSKISTTSSAPKAVGVGKILSEKWNNNFKKIILLENIKDAGNLGTILRTACAFDIDAIILYGDTVDLYNPKCVRSSVGNLWKVPVFNVSGINNLKELCMDYTPVATLPKAIDTVWLKDFVPPEKCLIMFGTESSGLSDELVRYAKEYGSAVTIKMSDNVESLNLSASAAIIIHSIYD